MARRIAALAAAAGTLGLIGVIYVWRRRKKTVGKASEQAAAPVAVEPSDAWELAMQAKGRGNKRFTGRQFDQAAAEYTKAIELAPDKRDKRVSVFHCNRAACYLVLERLDDCLKDCDAALEVDPSYVKALTRRGMVREKLDDLEGALVDFTGSCVLSGYEQQSTVQRGNAVLVALGKRQAQQLAAAPRQSLPSSRVISDFFRSFSSHRADLDRPGPSVDAARAEREGAGPVDATVLAGLLEAEAVALMKAKAFAEAHEAWEQAVAAWERAASSGTPEAEVRRAVTAVGTFHYIRGNLDEALSYLDRAMALDPKDVTVLIKRASVFLEKRDLAKCMDIFNEAFSLSAGELRADVLFHRGCARMLTNDVDQAVTELRASLELDKTNELTYIRLGVCLGRQKRAEEAKKIFGEGERVFPQSSGMRNAYGEMLFEMEDVHGAVRKFDEAMEMPCPVADAFLNKAQCALALSGGAQVEEVRARASPGAMAPFAHACPACSCARRRSSSGRPWRSTPNLRLPWSNWQTPMHRLARTLRRRSSTARLSTWSAVQRCGCTSAAARGSRK